MRQPEEESSPRQVELEYLPAGYPEEERERPELFPLERGERAGLLASIKPGREVSLKFGGRKWEAPMLIYYFPSEIRVGASGRKLTLRTTQRIVCLRDARTGAVRCGPRRAVMEALEATKPWLY